MHLALKSKSKEIETPIHIDYNLLENEAFLKCLKKHQGRFALITDEKVALLYSEALLTFMDRLDFDCKKIVIPSGEKHKTRKTKELVEDTLISHKLGRDTCLLVMGGGVVTDLGGFVAATYYRGIPYISLPTTLLGMVDASIGGKTGINVKQGKNLLGAFYPPKAIFMDLSTLSTLPEEEMLSGSAEIIKHALIADKALFNQLFEDLNLLKERDLEFLKKIVVQNCSIKKKIIEKDLKETGERRTLNFGHTISHALETLEEYTISHGEAVAIGMIVEGLISFKLGKLKEREFDQIYELIKGVGFPLRISEKVTITKMQEVMARDKKAEGSIPRFVILHGIGKVQSFRGAFCTPVNEFLLDEALGWMIAEFGR